MDAVPTPILIACRDAASRQALAAVLRAAGYPIVEAGGPGEVLSRADGGVRLVVLAGDLAGMCGQLRLDPTADRLVLVALADETQEGADVTLPAAVAPGELLMRVRRLLASSQAIFRGSVTPYRELIDGLAAHVALLDMRGVILAVNEAWRNFAARNGGDPAKLCEGADYLAVCDTACGDEEKDARTFAHGLREVMAGVRGEFVHEYPCHSADELRWFVARIRRVRAGTSSVLMVTHENITDRRRVEEALARTNARLTDLLEGVADGFAALDADGRCVYFNRGLEIFLDASRDELAGRPLWDATGGQLGTELRERAEGAASSRKGAGTFELFFPGPGRWGEVSVQQAVGGLWLHVRDVTERRQEADRRDRERQDLLDHLRREVRAMREVVARPDGPDDGPLRERAAVLFEELTRAYAEALDAALERRMYKVADTVRERLLALADKLGPVGAGPRDVIDLHTTAIHEKTRSAVAGRAYTYKEEGRLLLVELMGNLASWYRAARAARRDG